jgi:two-component system response regulator AtoC
MFQDTEPIDGNHLRIEMESSLSGTATEKSPHEETRKYVVIRGKRDEDGDEASRSAVDISEETSLTHVFHFLPVPAILVDQSQRIRFVNRAVAKISSDFRSILGNDISFLFPRQSDYLAVRGLLETIADHGQAQIRNGEIRIGNSRVSCHIFLGALSLADKQFTLFLIEDRASDRQASLLNEACKALVAVFPAGVAQFDLRVPIRCKSPLNELVSGVMNAELSNGNSEFADMHGFARLSELRGARLYEFVLLGSSLERTIHNWVEAGLPIHHTIVEDSLGEDRTVQIEVALAPTIKDEHISSFWMVKRNIEQIRQGKTALLEAESHFRTVIDQVSDLILTKSCDSRYSDANPAAERFLGQSQSAIVGRTPEEIWGTDAGSKIRTHDLRALEGKTSEHICTRCHGGISSTVHLVTTPVRRPDGKIIGLIDVGHRVPDQLQPTSSAPNRDGVRAARLPVSYSEAMRKTLETVWLAAKTEGIILITGETGAGKDFLARLIHDRSNRAAGPFLSINCAAVPLEVAESELFGHEAGAFTGASKRKKGLLELAEGGTLLMNEIGDLPLPLQAKLLTFLDTRSFSRVGGEKQISVDVRILAATNRDLAEDMATGVFRKDLFYRLNVLCVTVPSLRDRSEDLPALVDEILNEFSQRHNLPCPPQLDPSIMKALSDYHWPGNVRELRSVLERAVVMSGKREISLSCLGLQEASREWTLTAHFPDGKSLNDVLDEVKESLIQEALRRAKGKRKDAAALLGISRNSLKHHMRAQASRENRP